jgi:hypothetical protein
MELAKLGIGEDGLAPMTMPAPVAAVPWSRIVASACLVLAVGVASGQTRPVKRPAPAEIAKQREPEKAAVKKPAPGTDDIKQREQELDSLRAEQQQATEVERKLAEENEMLAEDRRKLTAALVEGATRIRADEERVTAVETRLHELEGSEADIRKS